MSYQDGQISVDGNFARFGSKTYAINKINSTDIRVKSIPGSWGFYLWLPIAFLFTITAAGALAAPDQEGGTTGAVVVLGGLAALFWFQAIRSFSRRAPKKLYQLYLTTSSQEQQAYVSSDENEVARLKLAIEHAMAG